MTEEKDKQEIDYANLAVMPGIELLPQETSARRRKEIEAANHEDAHWLSPRVKMFCEYYLENNFDATVAAAEAGFDGDSRKDYADVAKKLLARGNVRRQINQRAGMYLKKHNVKIDRVINETACIAFFDEADLYDEFGKLIPVNKLPEKVRRGKGKDKLKALELLGKHLGIFSDKLDVKVKGNIEHCVSKVDLEERVKMLVDEKLEKLLE